MNDVIFSKSFRFRVYYNENNRRVDNRCGIQNHFFAYLESGTCRICTDHETIFVGQGDILYLPNGCRYQSYWHGDPGVRFISLAFGFLPNFENRTYGVQVIPGCARSVELFYQIAQHRETNAEAVGLFYTLAGILLPRMQYSQKDRRAELVETAKKYILHHPDADVSEIAKAAAVSESALYLAFQKNSEQSIREYKTAVRMEEARHLLLSSDITVEALSEHLRFSSDAYFRKCFKGYFGITPREMRKQYEI